MEFEVPLGLVLDAETVEDDPTIPGNWLEEDPTLGLWCTFELDVVVAVLGMEERVDAEFE